jgi:hypothetical protein
VVELGYQRGERTPWANRIRHLCSLAEKQSVRHARDGDSRPLNGYAYGFAR